jgi:short-subunit dehydrogenase
MINFEHWKKDMIFRDKTIWITGASSGIGRAFALEVSKEKCRLILSGRNESALREVALLCTANGSRCETLVFDLGVEKEVTEAASMVLGMVGRIDGLYHFGGISQRSFAAETPLFVDRKIFETNYFGTIALTKAVLGSMITTGGGQIAVTSSVVGKFGISYRSSYSASKHALHGFFESLRSENHSKNIKVTVIIPGRIKTNISLNAVDREGKAYSKMDEGQNKGMSAEKSAQIILRALKKDKKEVLFGGKEVLMVYIRRFFPFLYYFMSTRVKPL